MKFGFFKKVINMYQSQRPFDDWITVSTYGNPTLSDAQVKLIHIISSAVHKSILLVRKYFSKENNIKNHVHLVVHIQLRIYRMETDLINIYLLKTV